MSTDPDGYAQLLTLAESHGGMRGWAVEGAGGYGAGLTRHLHQLSELVVELDRPVRPATARTGHHRPEPVQARFRGQTTRQMLTTATRLRPSTAAADVEVFTAARSDDRVARFASVLGDVSS